MTDLYDNHTFPDSGHDFTTTDSGLPYTDFRQIGTAGPELPMDVYDRIHGYSNKESVHASVEDNEKFRQSLYETRKAHSYPGEGLSETTITVVLMVLINGLFFGAYLLWKHFF